MIWTFKSVDAAFGNERWIDRILSALLALQGITLFLVIPLNNGSALGRFALDICHLAFALICIGMLTRHRAVQLGLIASVVLLVAGPPFLPRLRADLAVGAAAQHQIIAIIALVFNSGVTALVATHVFATGRVTGHRVRGAILLYLNVAALFAIVYGVIAMAAPAAFAFPHGSASGAAAFSYFSLTTITTTGFGDIVPVSPLARSLANLEAVFGQLFPATLLTRLVSLHLAHESAAG